jgi:hypothetical protein
MTTKIVLKRFCLNSTLGKIRETGRELGREQIIREGVREGRGRQGRE